MEKVIEVTNLTKKFGSRTVIKDLSFTLAAGEIVALVGPSGVGKSTILNILGLLEAPTSGTVKINGQLAPRKLAGRKAMLLRRNTLNYLFQTNALLPDLTVRHNLQLALKYSKLSAQEAATQIQQVLSQVELADRSDDQVATLSGGEQQRVALARTLLKPGQIILADEPTGALDDKLAHRVFDLLLDLSRTYHKTVVLVTHNQTLAKQCDRQIELSKQ